MYYPCDGKWWEEDRQDYGGSLTWVESHNWGEASYAWSEDNSMVTAAHACQVNADHVETETVRTSYEVITAPTTESEGLGRYTAVFEKLGFETQTKEVVIDMFPGYAVSISDYTKTTATDLDPSVLYSGEVVFTVSSEEDKPVLVAVKNGDSYTVLPCTTDENGVHSFTAEISDDTTIALVFRGDVNLNGKLETRDATLVCQVKNGAYGNELNQLAADVNNNGKVETRDATLLCQARSGNYTIPW